MKFSTPIFTVLFLSVCLFTGCTDHKSIWDYIQDSNELRFVTIETPATYYSTDTGISGLEYELAKEFAKTIGVNLRVLVVPSSYRVITTVKDRKAAIGGAALSGFKQLGNLRFSPPYYHTPQQLVYRNGDQKPLSIRDIPGNILNISGVQLEKIKDKYPHLIWNAYYDKDIDKLLRMVQEGEIQSTVASANMVSVYQHLYPDIRVAFDLTSPQPLSWVYLKSEDELHKAITNYFEKIRENGQLSRLIEKYYGHIDKFDFIDTQTFLSRINERLYVYENIFRNIAEKYELDWKLLAAISYQESHWQPGARSPTGVRGLMMLTQDTARHVGIDDRLDPDQSIEGGARYYKEILERIPEQITDPDRVWFALAAYNIGFQHLEDARVLAQKQGKDPDRWKDVRTILPLLSIEKWHKQTRYGYARGSEPVTYVKNIRRYYDILRWINYTSDKHKEITAPLQTLIIDSPVL